MRASLRIRAAIFTLGSCASVLSAQAQTPADPYAYSRVSSFTYQSNGLLQSETIEPDRAQLCLSTSYAYDAYGNKSGATTTHCAATTGIAQITSRTSSTSYAASTGRIGHPDTGTTIAIPAGTLASSATNALNHSESRVYDPRFGVPVSLTGPNALTTKWTLDDFGRKTLEQRADGTRTATWYCWLAVTFNGVAINTASNTPGCPAPPGAEIPGDAVRFEHSVVQDSGGAAIGAWSRVYYDRAGRKIRTASEGFDGASQPGGAARTVVADTDHNAWGTPVLVTQPYFLGTGSSLATGSAMYGMTLTDIDALGRPSAIYTTDPQTGSAPNYPDGGAAGGSQASVAFGARGSHRAARTTIAYAGLVVTTTDDKGRTRIEEKNPEGKLIRVTDASGSTAGTGAQIVHDHDAFGNLLTTKDALGNLVRVAYDIRGRKVSLNDPDAGVTAYCHDALGQLKAQQSSNQRAGHTLQACPAYSGAGSTVPASPPANWTHLAYDVLGRMTQRVEPEYTSTWSYDSCTKGVGKLCASTTSHGITKTHVYDSLGRAHNTRTDVSGGISAASAVAYDAATGRVASQTWPSGVKVNYNYTARGWLSTITLATAVTLNPLPATAGGTPGSSASLPVGTALWTASAVNAWGKSEQHAYGNAVNNRAVFGAQSGRLVKLTAGAGAATNVVDQRYAWDSVNLLVQRIDALGEGSGVQVLDTFLYDKLGRLVNYTVSGGSPGNPVSRAVSLQYNALGMVLSKSDVGNYSYPAQGTANGRPHAVQSISGAFSVSYSAYDWNGNATAASAGKWRSIAYTSFNLPDGTNGIQGAAASPKQTWQYDESHQRIKDVRINAQGTRTTWSLHPDAQGGLAFEHEAAPDGTISNRHYVSAGGMAFAVLVTRGALPALSAGQTAPNALTSTTAVKLEYWHKDQQGSLIATTDHAGAITGRYAYDPFGKRRYTNASYDAFGNLIVDWTTNTNAGTDRGYTGHEHLDELGLVHMNGRIYDPTIGRILQTDPFIQDPANLQNYDRYGYCFNSPTVCTDPTGYFSLKKFLRAAVAIAAAVYVPQLVGNWFLSGAAASASGATAFAVADVGYGLTTLGSVTSAAAGGFAAGAISSGNMKGGLQGALSAGIFFGAGEAIQAGQLGGNAVASVAIHGVAGCVSSVSNGGKCGPGALSAAFSKTVTVNGFTDAANPIEGTIKSAIAGGIGSVLGGGKFANGAQTGAFSYLFNELAHSTTAAQRGYAATFYPEDHMVCDTTCWTDKPLEGVYPELALAPAGPIARTFGAVASWFGFGAQSARMVTVGRWMSPEEYALMTSSGRLVESNLGGVTSVAFPASSTAYTNAAAGSVYAEFRIAADSLRAVGNGWGKIYGPNSIFGPKLLIRKYLT